MKFPRTAHTAEDLQVPARPGKDTTQNARPPALASPLKGVGRAEAECEPLAVRDRAPRYNARGRKTFGIVDDMMTGPWSVGPESGAVWGGDFPTLVLRDAVAEQKAPSCSPGGVRIRIEVGVGFGGPPRAAADNESCQADILRRHGSAEAERIADGPFALESASPAEARHWFPGVRIGVMVVAISPAVSAASDDSRDRMEVGPDQNTLAASARPCHIGYCMSEIRGEVEV